MTTQYIAIPHVSNGPYIYIIFNLNIYSVSGISISGKNPYNTLISAPSQVSGHRIKCTRENPQHPDKRIVQDKQEEKWYKKMENMDMDMDMDMDNGDVKNLCDKSQIIILHLCYGKNVSRVCILWRTTWCMHNYCDVRSMQLISCDICYRLWENPAYGILLWKLSLMYALS